MQLRVHSAQSAVSGPAAAAACSVTLQKVALTARARLSKAGHGWPDSPAILLLPTPIQVEGATVGPNISSSTSFMQTEEQQLG